MITTRIPYGSPALAEAKTAFAELGLHICRIVFDDDSRTMLISWK
jgi:hypothetical protein